MSASKSNIPLHTKIGIRVSIAVALIICFMLVKNCIRAVHYGKTSSETEITSYYKLGYKKGHASGREPGNGKVLNAIDGPETEIINPLLLKAFMKGFREGKDATDTDDTK